MICLCTAQRQLCKLRYKYKDIHKDVSMNRYKRSNIVENCKIFFIKIKKLKLYMVEFKEDCTIKSKAYSSNYAIKGDKRQSIIVITYNKYIFSINNRI